jgi:fructose-bisphosphate aldolase class II
MHKLLLEAKQGNYAIPAMNFCNLETIYPMLQAAKNMNAPIILQAAASEIYYFGESFIVECIKKASDQFGVTVAIHLDHGKDYDEAIKCINRGFTSVMFDGSTLPYEDNLKITKSIVKVAHVLGVSVEGELGKILGAEDSDINSKDEGGLTDPYKAAEFIKESGVDALAVAVGSAHGIKVENLIFSSEF